MEKNIDEQLRNKLREPLPKEAVTPHPTKTYLSSIKAIYVVERLNDCFGVGKWFQTSEIIRQDSKMIVVKSYLKIPEYGIQLEAFGGNDNTDLGDAYKGAVTDALTKMASYIEIGIDVFKGLADKKPNDKQPSDKQGDKWLNPKTPEWQEAIKFLVGGGTINQIKTKYKISQTNQELLISQAV